MGLSFSRRADDEMRAKTPDSGRLLGGAVPVPVVALREGRVRPDGGAEPEDEPLMGSLLGDAWRGPLAVPSPMALAAAVVVDEDVVLVLGLRSERARARPLGGADDCIAGKASLGCGKVAVDQRVHQACVGVCFRMLACRSGLLRLCC